MITFSHYKISQVIYESANSLVYRAMRKKDNEPVILKILKQDYPSLEELTRYRQEYEITQRLADLEGVINVYTLEKYDNTLMIALEDFGGESLKKLTEQRQLTLDKLLQLAIRAADILGHIHQQQIIHKDINPSNLIFNPTTGLLKIIDFGIASQLSRENPRLKNPNLLEGSLPYLSPEQTGRMNRFLDYRTDLYSLGITFYKLLSGKLPFESTDPLELIHCHIAKTPKPLCEINSDVPQILSNIVMKLMTKNVEERYQSAFGVKADLCKCLKNSGHFENIKTFNFELAQNDFSGKLQIPQKLYGRETEIEILLQAFERVANHQVERIEEKNKLKAGCSKIELMLIAGYSGVGKTALVHEVHKPITEKRGYFAAGKFEQYQRTAPYFAFKQAFNAFCDYLLSESSEQLKQWRDKILNALGANGQILIDLIPHLELIIGQQPTVAQVGPQESQNRFNFVFQNFMKAICQPAHPLILFIDDLQWADLASLNLLKILMTDPDTHSCLIIGAYRDNEVDATHPLLMTIEELKTAHVVINTITLPNLSLNHVNTLIAETLKHESTQTHPLSHLVYQKTQGNTFFTREFLKSLFQEGLLVFDFKNKIWQWTLGKIRSKDMTDNVVDLMVSKINQLPTDTIAVLKLAGGIGNTFDLKNLSIIYQKTQKITLHSLYHAIKLGFIFPLNENYKLISDKSSLKVQFKFQHDRVQQAAYSLIAESDKKTIHLQIGHLLLANIKAEDLDAHLFHIVNQLNAGYDLIADQAEKLKLAELNLKACQKAKEATAYVSAQQYVAMGMALINSDTWQQTYSLTFALHKESAEIAYLNGHFEKAEKWIYALFPKTQTTLEKIELYYLLITQHVHLAQSEEALLIGRKVFDLLRINWPSDKDIQKALDIEVTELQKKIGDQDISSLLKQPEINNPEAKILVHLVLKLTEAAYMLGLETLISFLFAKVASLAIKYGPVAESSLGYLSYGIVQSFSEDYHCGYEFGLLALKLSKQFNNLSYRCIICENIVGNINYLVNPLKSADPIFQEGYQAGLVSGTFTQTSYLICHHVFSLFYRGESIEKTIMKLDDFMPFLQKNKLWFVANSLFDLKLVLCHLSTKGRGKSGIKKEKVEDIQNLEFCKNNLSNLCLFHILRAYIFYYYDNPEKGLECALEAEKLRGAIAGLLFETAHHFYYSLNLIACYPNKTVPEQKEYWLQLDINQKKMKIWVESCPENFGHQYGLIEAEMARLADKKLAAMELYDRAIASAKDNGFIQNEALANELSAKFWLGLGKEEIAQLYLKKAYHGNQLWGAKRKVQHLEEKYPQWLLHKTASPQIQSHSTLSISTTDKGAQWLDLNSLMKAAQTLSGEIVLRRLLEKMIHIVIENAGASIGFLLLNQQNHWFIEAQGQIDSDEVKVLQSLSIENQPIPQKIIHYVERTQEYIVLNHATEEGQFTHDPYILKQHPKSVLCTPLKNQGQLTGILYLENNLTTGAFTPERIEVLNLLSSQIAISIENARLYSSISRFLPREFLSLLDKKNIIDVQLGDQIEKEMSILFADIRDFTALSEMMTPQENFDFINGYLSRMAPIIAEHHGFIDKYIGDAIMALFPASADEAVRASCAMLKKLTLYNQERQESGLKPIAIGIGLNTGLLMLGTVGAENRMDGTVISDAVNLASRIEGMTKMYGAALLISEETYAHLSDVSQYAIRRIDRVKVKGKSEAVSVYEVFDSEAPHLFELKMKTGEDFENGLRYYRQKKFTKAISCFEQVLSIYPDDKAAQIYLNRCQHWQKVGVPDDWEGIEALDSK